MGWCDILNEDHEVDEEKRYGTIECGAKSAFF